MTLTDFLLPPQIYHPNHRTFPYLTTHRGYGNRLYLGTEMCAENSIFSSGSIVWNVWTLKICAKQYLREICDWLLCLFVSGTYTVCLNKKETGTNMPIPLKLDKHLNNFGYYLSKGYLLFSMVPRNLGSITSVNENEHFHKRLKIWLCNCTKSFKF